MIGEETDRFDFDRRPVGNKLFPVLLRWIAYRRCHNAKVFRALICSNVEEFVAVIDVVLVFRLSRDNHPRFSVRLGSKKIARLSRSLAERLQKYHFLVARTAGV